jgi:hypothetical protein
MSVRRATLLISSCALATSALFGCRRGATNSTPTTTTPSASTSISAAPSASAVAPLAPLAFERFIDARLLRPSDPKSEIEVAGLARDLRLHRARYDASLHLSSDEVLASDIVARDDTHVALAGAGVVVTGDHDARTGAFFASKDLGLVPMDSEWCAFERGATWLSRDATKTIVHGAIERPDGRTSSNLTAPPIAVALDHEAHLFCGPNETVVGVSDGETFEAARIGSSLEIFLKPITLVPLERDEDFKDELRERVMALDESGGWVVRIGAGSIAARSIYGTNSWRSAHDEKGHDVALDEDAVVISSAVGGSVDATDLHLLVLEPTTGAKTCAGSEDLPRSVAIVTLHATPAAPALTLTRRTIAELPCGVEAISGGIQAKSGVARVWWTEPLADASCAQPALTVGGLVAAQSDRPGARHLATIAEGAVRLDDTRWLAVTRPGGCVPYETPGSGALTMLTLPAE